MNILQNHSLLYIEDEDEIRNNYSKYFTQVFGNVYLAASAEEGLILYERYQPKVIIVDVSLKKMDGLSFVKQIRKNDHNTKVIVLSAHSDTVRLLKATELKLTKYLVKPVTRVELQEALGLVVDEFSRYQVIESERILLKDGLIWDKTNNELIGGESLTKNETKLMEILCANPTTIHRYDDIIYQIWWDIYEDKRGALKSLVKNLRKKLPEGTIENIHSQGYRIHLK